MSVTRIHQMSLMWEFIRTSTNLADTTNENRLVPFLSNNLEFSRKNNCERGFYLGFYSLLVLECDSFKNRDENNCVNQIMAHIKHRNVLQTLIWTVIQRQKALFRWLNDRFWSIWNCGFCDSPSYHRILTHTYTHIDLFISDIDPFCNSFS